LINLFFYINRTNREVARFLTGIRYEDQSIRFPEKSPGAGFAELYDAFREVQQKLNERYRQRSVIQQFHEHLTDQAVMGFLVLDDQENVLLCNPALQELFQIPAIRQLNTLRHLKPELANKLGVLEEGERQVWESLVPGRPQQSLVVRKFSYTIHSKPYQLFVFQNIREIAEDIEIKAWSNLIRVLTHEIMNSVNTIDSLAGSSLSLLEKEQYEDLEQSLKIIRSRSDGLTRFVENYRKVTQVKKPQKQWVSANQLLKEAIELRRQIWEERKISLEMTSEDQLQLQIDRDQIIQVLLNLFLNSEHALGGTINPRIQIRAYREGNYSLIEVEDNGRGIPAKDLQSVFIPFFTTREQGSGIGLSLSRQILWQHGGSISIESLEGEWTVARLRLSLN
jgi:two-component system nitrogen regulation sensor histidine kinase NtrY